MRQPIRFGKYLLLDRIAVGGMAEVFLAKAFGVEGFERLLAIKKILPTLGEDPEFVSMFVDEARIAVQLSHASIVQILELGKHDESLYIAMEYISGRDVRQVLERFRRRGEPMPLAQACLIASRVCEALDYAHRKRDTRGQPLGIVHRDVSPQNVIVSFDGDVKLIDFGIAKAESRLQTTQAGILKGKFSYMSPEQVRGDPVDRRSDVFAAGVLLWELLCGEKLFTGESDFAVLDKVRNGKIPPPSRLNPAVTPSLEAIVLRALSIDVEARYQWASELHEALSAHVVQDDGQAYGGRQLAGWMRTEFAVEVSKEEARLQACLTPDSVSGSPRGSSGIELPSIATVLGTPAKLAPRVGPAAAQPGFSTLPDRPVMVAPAGAAAAAAFRLPVDKDTLVQPPSVQPKSSAPPNPAAPVPPPSAAGRTSQEVSVSKADQELPTMKIDGAALIEAEKAFAQRRAQEEHDRKAATAATEAPFPAPTPVARLMTPAATTPATNAAHAVHAAVAPLDLALAVGTGAAIVPAASAPAASVAHRPVQPAGPRSGGGGMSGRGGSEDPPRRKWAYIVAPLLLLAALGGWYFTAGMKAPKSGKIILTLAPNVPAQLFVDGAASGALPPLNRSLPAGAHSLEVRADGFQPFTTQVELQPGASLEVAATLVEQPQGPQKMTLDDVELNQSAPRDPNQPAAAPVAKPGAVDRVVEARETARRAAADRAAADRAAAAQRAAAAAASNKSSKPAPAPAAPSPAPTVVAAAKPVATPPPPAPAPAPAAATVTTTTTGDGPPRLRVVTEPAGATILVDGKSIGQSPVTTGTMDAGRYHSITAELAGFSTMRRATKLGPAGITEFRLGLTPGTSTPSATAAAAAPEKAAQGFGYLVATSEPSARVSIDGKETGRWTPVSTSNPISVPAGAHTVAFVTSEGKREERQLQIVPGKVVRVVLDPLR